MDGLIFGILRYFSQFFISFFIGLRSICLHGKVCNLVSFVHCW